ncbi:MAG TPA: hypothetical protein VM911_11545 [Pyrinomonadaceae bacterium]|jgi:hypothetical protein|nr:hypothetical protein [Pyrinomonadaceae bacterium]
MKRSAAKRITKSLAIVLCALVLLFGLELGRERLVYRSVSKRIERAHMQLKPGMTKSEVQNLAGAPLEIIPRKPDEYWRWSAREYQGRLWSRLGLTSMKGHYDLIVQFNGEDKITKIFGGVN